MRVRVRVSAVAGGLDVQTQCEVRRVAVAGGVVWREQLASVEVEEATARVRRDLETEHGRGGRPLPG